MLGRTSGLCERAFTWYTQNPPSLGPASVISPKAYPLLTSLDLYRYTMMPYLGLHSCSFLYLKLLLYPQLISQDSAQVSPLLNVSLGELITPCCVPQDTRLGQTSFEGPLSLYYIYFYLISISESDLILNSTVIT